MFSSRFTLVGLLALAICWPTFSQRQVLPEILDKVGEETLDKSGKVLDKDASRPLADVVAKWDKESVAAALQQTQRNFVLDGAETSTASSFQSTVDQSFEKIRASLKINNTPQEADRRLIFSELKAVNDKRWLWARQKLSLNGDRLQVQPAWSDAGDVTVSMPKLRDFYVSAMSKLSLVNRKNQVLPVNAFPQ